MAEPNDFINSAEKLMANEFIKGCCLSFLESGTMEYSSYLQMKNLKIRYMTKSILKTATTLYISIVCGWHFLL